MKNITMRLLLLMSCVFSAYTLANKVENTSNILLANEHFQIENTGLIPYYRHKAEKALAINAGNVNYRNQFAYARYQVKKSDKVFTQLQLTTLTEIDGESRYQIILNDKVIGEYQNPETEKDYQESTFVIANITLKEGDVIKVASMAVTNGKIPENDETAFARGRWRSLTLK